MYLKYLQAEKFMKKTLKKDRKIGGKKAGKYMQKLNEQQTERRRNSLISCIQC